ncbi:MAG: hypothetical protein IKV07_05640 [Bacteroidaceae bacterium]|nr:hypothetical protein [Bacteroidaceae bacterium]
MKQASYFLPVCPYLCKIKGTYLDKQAVKQSKRDAKNKKKHCVDELM